MATRSGENTAEAIRAAAVRLFNDRGYEATSLRDLAGEVGIKVGSLYNHIASKEDLLYGIMSTVMQDLIESLDHAIAQFSDPVDRLRAAIEVHVLFHAQRADEVFIGNSELRSLPPVKRAAIVEYRDAYENRVHELIEAGIKNGRMFATDVRLTTYAIVAIGTHVAGWYDPRGRLSLADIASLYVDLIFRSLMNPEQQVETGQLLMGATIVDAGSIGQSVDSASS